MNKTSSDQGLACNCLQGLVKRVLGCYYPGFYEFIVNGVFGTKIEVIENALALANETDYGTSSQRL
jgi:hypothetical protein